MYMYQCMDVHDDGWCVPCVQRRQAEQERAGKSLKLTQINTFFLQQTNLLVHCLLIYQMTRSRKQIISVIIDKSICLSREKRRHVLFMGAAILLRPY
jgi:hypothetical protein